MEWTSVKKRLPERSVYCLCIHYKNLPYIAMYHEDEKEWVDHDGGLANPTHWMALPDPPIT